MIARANKDGRWDKTFGAGGAGHLGDTSFPFGTTPVPNVSVQRCSAATFDHAGNIVGVGWNEGATTGTIVRIDGITGAPDPLLVTARYSATGEPDLSYDSKGMHTATARGDRPARDPVPGRPPDRDRLAAARRRRLRSRAVALLALPSGVP